MVFAFVTPSDAQAPGRVRDQLREALHDALNERPLRDLELLLTELVANAVRHGSARENDSIAVRVSITAATVSVSVTDTGDGFERSTVLPSPRNEAGGFGLLLLDRLSSRWGVERSEDGFRIWFRLYR